MSFGKYLNIDVCDIITSVFVAKACDVIIVIVCDVIIVVVDNVGAVVDDDDHIDIIFVR
jgi:hypothetical protein